MKQARPMNLVSNKLLQTKGAVEPDSKKESPENLRWKLLIVDDELAIHDVTKMVLSEFKFDGGRLEFLHAFSGEEAKRIINDNPDIAIILLDVVMETDDSGLMLVKHIRNKLNNSIVRIILRTGQPGQAPEQAIIENYDINDFKEKTELTSQKLVTSIITSLRSYMGILTIAKLNDELEEIVRQRTASLEESLQIIRQDEEAGKIIQFKLLPQSDILLQGYRFNHQIIPSLYLSGDFVDYFQINETQIGFYIADVSGHGASSAFVTILLKSFINNFLDKYHSENNQNICCPSTLLNELNLMVIKENLEKHLTLFYGVIDTQKNELTFSNGGQYPFPVLFDGKTSTTLKYKGLPVGLIEFAQFEQHTVSLPNEFSILFLSDGVLEILPERDTEKQQIVFSQLVDNLDTKIDTVIKKIGVHEHDTKPDDLTFLMIQKKGGSHG